jgi:type I restriction enzyme S subunit
VGGDIVSDARAANDRAQLRQYKPHPAYKDSGVAWLGQIPAHWDVKRTKFAARLRSGHTPSRQHPEYWQDCTIPWFGLADVWQIRDGQTEYVFKTAEKISELGLANSAARLLPKDTVLLSRTASVGFSAIMGVDMATTQDFVNWVCGPSLRPEYLLYVFRSMQGEFRRLTMGSTHQTIYMPDVGQFSTSIPPISEQDQIVAFIRANALKIDEVVARNERLIEQVQEKRAALITHAVTKGFNSNVPMKESGVEWLGEVPAHWEVTSLKRISSIRYGLGEPPKQLTNGLPFIRATNISKGRIVAADMQFIDPSDVPWNRDPVLRSDDIIVVRSGAYTGDSAIVPAEYDGAIIGYDMVLRPRRGRARFLSWALLSRYVLESQIELESMRAAQPHLNAEELGAVRILLPPDSEQDVIAAFLDCETEKIDVLVAKISEAINTLKEHRTALISAAVTGKIDVRQEAA